MKCKTVRALRTEKTPQNPDGVYPPGTVIDNKDAFWLVKMGVANPEDDECRKAAGMTDEQIAEAQRVYPRTEAGIRPEDFELWDRGVIVGYEENGDYKPGPNWVDQDSDLYEDESEGESDE